MVTFVRTVYYATHQKSGLETRVLPVGFNDFSQCYMGIPIPGIGVFFRERELYGSLRTGMDTCQTSNTMRHFLFCFSS